MSAPSAAFEGLLTAFAQRKPALALDTLDLGFLVALFLRARDAQLSSFSETGLRDVYEQAAHLLEPSAEQRSKRATHAIARLREQRLLARVDGHGVVRSGEYALTRLATGIVEFFLEEDVLTPQSLTLLTSSLHATLSAILVAARAADGGSDECWTNAVVGPLRVTIAELVAGIERRQRGLDLQQESFQAEIRLLLEADWFVAIERCQTLLESTSATLRELSDALLRDSSQLLELLHDIEELAVSAGASEAEAAVLQVVEQLDRITAWGGSRQRAWSEYFQYVHRYLRDVVRLDPTRALTQRLRDQLKTGAGQRYALTIAGALPLQLLRATTPLIERPAVTRPRAAREREPVPDAGIDAQLILEQRVEHALSAGARTLADVTEQVNAEVHTAERFAMTGRVAQTAASLAEVRAERERPWIAVEGNMEIEDWQVRQREPGV